MNTLSRQKILILDCQTTGMHPNKAHLLQIGWSIFDPQDTQFSPVETWTLQLPNQEIVSEKIKNMLHLSDEDFQNSVAPKLAFNRLQDVLGTLGAEPVVIAHYAQFEQGFLKKWYLEQTDSEQLNFHLLCSQKIAKRLLPQIPSHNLKAISGYFEGERLAKNDIQFHVVMTLHVWKHLHPKLMEEQIGCYNGLSDWLQSKRKQLKPSRYEYHIERLKRLELSDKPGVYRMLAKDRTVLYVGKATSLKSRVNSYFRGVKNRDRRKLEMLAQVWDIEIQECETPIEAALLESDEIKKWNPPYNILLKSEQKTFFFYNHDFSICSELQNAIFYNGPYKPVDSVTILGELFHALTHGLSISYGDECLTFPMLHEAWLYFCTTHHFKSIPINNLNMRTLLAMGFILLRRFERAHGRGTFQKWWATEKKNITEEVIASDSHIAGKIARILIRAAEAKRKVRMLWRLANSKLMIQGTNKVLTVINGQLNHTLLEKTKYPLHFTPVHYDRLSILLFALNNQSLIII